MTAPGPPMHATLNRPDDDTLWNYLDNFYSQNEKAILAASKADVLELTGSKRSQHSRDDSQSIFLKYSATILPGLELLGELNPGVKGMESSRLWIPSAHRTTQVSSALSRW